MSRTDPDGRTAIGKSEDEDGVPTDGIAGIQTRRSLQSRRSTDHRRSSSSIAYLGDREGLMRSYDVEGGAFGLTELTEETDNEHESNDSKKHDSMDHERSVPKSGDP